MQAGNHFWIVVFSIMCTMCTNATRAPHSEETRTAEQKAAHPQPDEADHLYGILYLNRGLEPDTIHYLPIRSKDGADDYMVFSARNSSDTVKSLNAMRANPCVWRDSIAFHEFLPKNSSLYFCSYIFNAKEKTKEQRIGNTIKLFFKNLSIDVLPDHMNTYEPMDVFINEIWYTIDDNRNLIKIEYFLSNGFYETLDFTYTDTEYREVFNRYRDDGTNDWTQRYTFVLPVPKR